MLAIEVEYLLGRAFASDFRDQDVPEWPPHPDRLFSALVAAHHDTFGTEPERSALAWFQRLAPPEVSCGQAGAGNSVVNFVPTNYARKPGSTHPDQRGKQPRTFPVQGPSSPLVHFTWRSAEPDDSVREALAGLVSRVPSLGRSCSLVRVSLSDTPGNASHVPDERGSDVLRVFGDQRMEELEALFIAGQRPQSGPQQRYRKLNQSDRPQAIPSCFEEMIILRKTGGRGFPVEGSLTLTKALRKALMAVADDHGLMTDMLSGHGAHPHCAFVPLPFVGYPHADGHMVGVAVVLPRGISWKERRCVVRTCTLLTNLNIREAVGGWTLDMAGFDIPQRTLWPSTWIGPSRVWRTVTPILLDRYPKKKLTPEDILVTACERVGLPVPQTIECQPHSSLDGVPPVSKFRLLRGPYDRPHWGVHATLRFEVDVSGPVLLGAGRYFGLGLMKPVQESRDDS